MFYKLLGNFIWACILWNLLVINISCQEKQYLLRPTLKTLKHRPEQKFIGHQGIKELCEKFLGMRYILSPIIEVSSLKNKTKNDLDEPNIYKEDEDKYATKISENYLADIYVRYIDDELGYGIFANSDIKKDDLIGEYAGKIIENKDLEDSSWAWSYPREIYKKELNIPESSIDAKMAGNALRFSNHSDNPNVEVKHLFLNGFVRIIYVANKNIKKDQQILVNYGQAYWSGSRKKQDL